MTPQIVDCSVDEEGGAAMHGVGRQKARRSTGTRRQVLRRWRQATILADEPFFLCRVSISVSQ